MGVLYPEQRGWGGDDGKIVREGSKDQGTELKSSMPVSMIVARSPRARE